MIQKWLKDKVMSAITFAKKHLNNARFPSEKTRKTQLWDVSGILKNRYNERFKFDVRPLKIMFDNKKAKKGSTKTKADKMVVETLSQWLIVDIKELHEYIFKNKIQHVYVEQIIKDLEWNVIIQK
jgi:hypothetical protein|tara:strand:+ start:163 stop:537 length:375 start_codon:yes stop_codon:yes gene_type:complete